MRKYVFSTSLEAADWANTTVVADDPVGAVRRLKEEGDGGIVQYGFGRVSFALLEAGLLDELRLWVHPFMVGRGGPEALLYRDTATTTFAVHDVTRLYNGLVVLTYRR